MGANASVWVMPQKATVGEMSWKISPRIRTQKAGTANPERVNRLSFVSFILSQEHLQINLNLLKYFNLHISSTSL